MSVQGTQTSPTVSVLPYELDLPYVDISTPYNEDEIVAIVTEIYKLMVKLCYVSSDAITWPPSVGHKINMTLCEELHLDPSVVLLIKHLPYPRDLDNALKMDLSPFSRPYCYLDDGELRCSRDPERVLHRCRPDYLLPTDLALSFNPRDGMSVVIDTKESGCIHETRPLLPSKAYSGAS